MDSYSHVQYAWFATRYTTNISTLLQTSFFTTAVTVLLEYFDCLLGLYNCMRSTSQPSEPSLRVSKYITIAVMYKNYPTPFRFVSFSHFYFHSGFYNMPFETFKSIRTLPERERRCHRDACFPGYRVSRTHIPRDACFPAHISLTHLCL